MKRPEASKSNIPGYIRGRFGKILCNPGRWLNIVFFQFYSTPLVLSTEFMGLPWILPWILELYVSDVLYIFTIRPPSPMVEELDPNFFGRVRGMRYYLHKTSNFIK
jgi:hypothetical protein